MQKKPTLKTLAEETGLALTPISRALANDEKIARSTRQMVAEVAERIGYVPDRAAQRLRTGRTNVIALVVSPHEEILGFRGSMIAGLTAALRGTRYHLSMTPYDWDEDPLVPIRHIVQNRLADGLVFFQKVLARPGPRLLYRHPCAGGRYGRRQHARRWIRRNMLRRMK